MGLMGRYIDALTDEGRDRIITAQGWTTSLTAYEDAQGCRCLRGHAENITQATGFMFGDPDLFRHINQLRLGEVAYIYPRAARRFGLERVVRACKLRAARGNAPALADAPLAATSTA